MIADRDVDRLLAGVFSPTKLKITSSSTVEFHAPEDHGNRENLWGTLLWEFEVLQTSRADARQHPLTGGIPSDLPCQRDLYPVDPTLPDADKCNCQRHTNQLHILVNMVAGHQDPIADTLAGLDLSDEDAAEGDEGSHSEDEPEDNSDTDAQTQTNDDLASGQIFPVVGSSWQACYQESLDKCSALRRDGHEVNVRATFEPSNLKDKNALKFEVFVDSVWSIIGYCPVRTIPKLTRAINKGEVMSIVMDRLKLEYCIPAKKRLYRAYLKIVKKGTWERDNLSFKYNDVIAP
ncbi:uncharacterized protein LOC118417063 [Branchiostoma floridae]|uniref:Uncharacterized protein LOC118417063 n=1 Tax=Branchiostoma floridae TaxID=7739 RepID=A0A9J7L8Q3_BRAFL|nr:uncharacterized protein LOC118417063 [Branchiostoma floridae]